MPPSKRYWFAAKSYGWGWGLPLTWQGWLCLATFWLLQLAGFFILAVRQPLYFVPWFLAGMMLLFAVCWWKGEPPRWRGLGAAGQSGSEDRGRHGAAEPSRDTASDKAPARATTWRTTLAVAATLVGVVNFFAFLGGALKIGGDAVNGKAVAGHYFVANHGRLTEVSHAVYTYSTWHVFSLALSTPLAMCGMAYLALKMMSAASPEHPESQRRKAR